MSSDVQDDPLSGDSKQRNAAVWGTSDAGVIREDIEYAMMRMDRGSWVRAFIEYSKNMSSVSYIYKHGPERPR